jgi:Putative metallopeptidase
MTEKLQDSGVVEAIANDLNRTFRLPNDLMITHRDCDVANAEYDPRRREVVICYQLVDEVRRTVYDPSITDEFMESLVEGTWIFVIHHEIGHALIDQYELPITGREEDAADEFATLMMIEADLALPALSAAVYWLKADDEKYTTVEFADEHSFDRQRFYAIVCTVYGSSPDKYSLLVEQGILPEDEAERCGAEYEQKVAAWRTLLEPYFQ